MLEESSYDINKFYSNTLLLRTHVLRRFKNYE